MKITLVFILLPLNSDATLSCSQFEFLSGRNPLGKYWVLFIAKKEELGWVDG